MAHYESLSEGLSCVSTLTINPSRCVRVSRVFVCPFWGFTPYLRPIFTQQPQGEITSYSPTQLCFLSVSMATRGMSHHVYLPDGKIREQEEEEVALGDGEDTLGLECAYEADTYALTLLCIWNNQTRMHETQSYCRYVTAVRVCSLHQEHFYAFIRRI